MGIMIISLGVILLIAIWIGGAKYAVWKKTVWILLLVVAVFIAISLLFVWGFERGLNRKFEENRVHSECRECVEKIEKQNRELQWRELRCGLWENKHGEVGFRVQMAVCEGSCFAGRYITRIYTATGGQDTTLLSVVDTTTFHALGAFYKDKNHIYEHYDMSDGGTFRIWEDVDYATFRLFEECYAKDKHHIYCIRQGLVDADYNTFEEAKGGGGCLGRDKYGYFSWGERIDLKGWNRKEIKELKRMFE